MAKAVAYCHDVVSGAIPAGQRVIAACRRQLADLARQDDPAWPYRFDEAKAGRVCRFMEQLPHVKGDLAGHLLRLEGWQAFVFTTAFGWVRKDTGARRFRRVVIFVPRGNGKSFQSSGVALYCLSADGEGGAEVYAAATTRDQAKIVWGDADAMLRRRPELRERLGLEIPEKATASRSIIHQPRTGSRFVPLSREADNYDGLNIHCVIEDEIHAHPTRDLHDVLETATAKRSRSLMWVISTAGSNTSGIGFEICSYARKLLDGVLEDESLFAVIYEADDDDDWTSEATWRKANPNWGVSVQPDVVGQLARKAMQMASAQNNFKTKHLNIWCNADVAWIKPGDWAKCGDPDLELEHFTSAPCFIGLDLASTTDISAKAKLFVRDLPHRDAALARSGATERHYYLFLDAFLPEGAVVDGRNSQYQGWEIDGWIKTTPGPELDFGVIKESLLEDRDRLNVREVAYDPWQALYLTQELLAAGLPMVECRPSVQNFSGPMKDMEGLVLSGRLHHDGNPLLAWMASNVVCHRDAKDNIYPRKESHEKKIDGIVATISALWSAMMSASDEGPYTGSRGLRSL